MRKSPRALALATLVALVVAWPAPVARAEADNDDWCWCEVFLPCSICSCGTCGSWCDRYGCNSNCYVRVCNCRSMCGDPIGSVDDPCQRQCDAEHRACLSQCTSMCR